MNDPETIKAWLGIVAVAISLGTLVYSWVISRSRVNTEHLKLVDEKLGEHGSRLQDIETTLKHMPAKDDVNDLKLAIAELRGSVGRLDENLTGVNRAVRRMEDYLVKEKSK